MNERTLTPQQQTFLEVLFEEGVEGDFVKAKIAAGYSPNYATSSLVATLRDEIIEATKSHLTRLGPKAAVSIGDILSRPTQLGVRDKLAAAKDVLDRIGVVKTEKIEVTGSNLFILPAKRQEVEDDD